MLSLGYGVSLLFLTVSWGRCLYPFRRLRVELKPIVVVYGLSNLAKYLPGNIFHLAGRQIMGKQYGWSHRSVATATAIELSMHVAVSVVIATIFISLAPDQRNALVALTGDNVAAISMSLAVFAVAVIFGLAYMLKLQNGSLMSFIPDRTCLATAALLQSVFFVCLVMLFAATYAMTETAMGNIQLDLALSGIFMASWTAGLVVPGAPGGLAVREAVFVLLTGQLGYDVETMLAACIAMRIVTTLGEVWLALLAVALKALPE